VTQIDGFGRATLDSDPFPHRSEPDRSPVGKVDKMALRRLAVED